MTEVISSGALAGVRIARVATVPYSVVFQLPRQIEYTVRSGAQVTVITSDGPEMQGLQQAIPALRFIPVEIPRQLAPLKDVLALLRLVALFRREKFDLVHSTTAKAGLLAAIAAWLAGVPVRLHTFTGQPWLHLRGPVRWFARRSDWLICRLNTRCYADSASQRQFLIEQGIASAEKLFVIGVGSLDGVDCKRFDPARFPAAARAALRQSLTIPDGVPVLLFVGRITVDKGIRELMAAFRALKQTGSAAHLILAGPFDADGGGIPQSEVEHIPDVHVLGYTEHPEECMAVADILCLPSYREGFGTVVIEAAAMGLPTVGTKIYGLTDAVADGETGILVPPRDPVALQQALQVLLQNDALRLNMGQAAKYRAQTLFDSEQINGKVVEEYRALLHASGRN